MGSDRFVKFQRRSAKTSLQDGSMAEDCRRKWTTHEGVTAHAPRAGTVVGLQNSPRGTCVHPGLSSLASRCVGKGNVVHVISILSLCPSVFL